MDDYLLVPKYLLNWFHAALKSFYDTGIIGQFIVFSPIVYFLAKAIVSVFLGKDSPDE